MVIFNFSANSTMNQYYFDMIELAANGMSNYYVEVLAFNNNSFWKKRVSNLLLHSISKI